MKVGVFICECGGNISGQVDVNKLRTEAQSMPDVKVAEIAQFLCSKKGLDLVAKSIQENGLDRVVIASCSPHMHETVFRETISKAGLNGYLFDYVNIREHCSWVTDNKEEATGKAIDLLRGGVYRARALQPLTPMKQPINKHVLIIGGGVAGIMSALQIADSGYPVTLVERKPSIGGRMAQLSKTFPTLDCAPCILSPRMSDVARNPNIELLSYAEVAQITGSLGNFHVVARLKARGVDMSKCLGCGQCAEICPTVVKNEFDERLYDRKAIYRPFPEAVPSTYLIDFDNCVRCGTCVGVCPAQAINIEDEDRKVEFDVGAIIVATGIDQLDLTQRKNFGLQYPNVITALQMERIMINELAAGGILKRQDGERVKKLAYVLCSGSRDPRNGVPYCSKVCCPYTIKQAVLLKETLPYIRIWIYYTDIRMSGRGFEEFYRLARDLGISFIHGKPGEIILDPASGKLQLVAEDIDSGVLFRNKLDMVVLTPALIPSSGTKELAEKLRISLGDDYFIAEKHPKLAPVLTHRPGVFAAGAALGPRDVRDSVSDAQAASAQALKLAGSGAIAIEPVKAVVDNNLCNGCGVCVTICPYKAISLKDKKAVIDVTSCTGCGACVVACPEKALDLAHYMRNQIGEQLRGILTTAAKDIVVAGFFGDSVAYNAADAAGTARLSCPENMRIIRVPSTACVGEREILEAFQYGADAVMLSETEKSPEAKITEQRIEGFLNTLNRYGIEKERLIFQPLLLPVFRVLPKYFATYVDKIKKLGKLQEKTREQLQGISK